MQVNNINNTNFQGRTYINVLTDIHQYADKHCQLVNRVLEQSVGNRNTVLLDNGDLFKGIYPKSALIGTYNEAKKRNPNLEIVFNVGNNDPGYDSNDRQIFYNFVNDLNRNNIHVISSNIYDKATGKRPKGIEPYTIIERDGDKLMYLGFSADEFTQNVTGMESKKAVDVLTEMAPKLKNVIDSEKIKGIVLMVHDGPEIIANLTNKAKELGLKVLMALGGHVHYPYENEQNKIYMPEPFGASMLSFNINLHDQGDITEFSHKKVDSKGLDFGIFKQKINSVNEQEGYYKPIAKSVMDLGFIWDDEHLLKPSELGTFYADGIKNLAQTEIGIVPKGWIYYNFPYKENDYINKMDILTAFSQPVKPIFKITVSPKTLKDLYQSQLSTCNRLLESSQNMGITIENNQIKQIYIDNEPLLDENGNALNPDRRIVAAIDYFTVKDMDIDKRALSETMYDGIVDNFKNIENKYHKEDRYPLPNVLYS